MSLRSQVLGGLYWAGGTRIVGQLLNWAITIFVIRLLTPEDYGLLGMATVFVALLVLLGEAGLGAALVRAPEVDEAQLRRIFGAVILVNSTLFLLQFAAAPAIASFFGEEHLIAIIRVLGAHFLFGIFGVIPNALLARRLQFKHTSLIGLGGSACGSLTTLGLAYGGYGVWALVIGALVVQLFNTVAVNVLVPFIKRPDFSFAGMRRDLLFGGQVTAGRVIWFINTQADALIAGKLLGKELLGYYSVGIHLASLPVQRVSGMLAGVAFPAFARIQDEPGAVPYHVLRSVRLLSLVAFPVFFGISCTAPELVQTLLGPKWEEAALPLQLLALIMPLRLIYNFLPSAIDAVGRADLNLKNLLWASGIMLPAFLIGAQWGLLGLCLAWLIGLPVVFFTNLLRVLPVLKVDVPAMARAMRFPAFAGAIMYGAVVALKPVVHGGYGAIIELLVLVVAGVVSYGIAILALDRPVLREFVGMLKV